MEKFSLEYIFLECNVHGHCLGAELKLPIIRNGIQYDELFIPWALFRCRIKVTYYS